MKCRFEADVLALEYDRETGSLMVVFENVSPLSDQPIIKFDLPQARERVEFSVEPKPMHEASGDNRGSGG